MRTILLSCKFIIVLCLLGSGVLIVGSSFEIFYDSGKAGAEIQSGQISSIQEASVVPNSLDPINIILVLLCTGLIGFWGVRRQRHTLNDYVRITPPESKFDEEQLGDNTSKRENFHEEAADPDQCEIGMPCLV